MAKYTIKDYFETRLALLEPVFPLACHILCEGPDFSLEFNYKPTNKTTEGKSTECSCQQYAVLLKISATVSHFIEIPTSNVLFDVGYPSASQCYFSDQIKYPL